MKFSTSLDPLFFRALARVVSQALLKDRVYSSFAVLKSANTGLSWVGYNNAHTVYFMYYYVCPYIRTEPS